MAIPFYAFEAPATAVLSAPFPEGGWSINASTAVDGAAKPGTLHPTFTAGKGATFTTPVRLPRSAKASNAAPAVLSASMPIAGEEAASVKIAFEMMKGHALDVAIGGQNWKSKCPVHWIAPTEVKYSHNGSTFAGDISLAPDLKGMPLEGSVALALSNNDDFGASFSYDALRSGLKYYRVAIRHSESEIRWAKKAVFVSGMDSADGWFASAAVACKKLNLAAMVNGIRFVVGVDAEMCSCGLRAAAKIVVPSSTEPVAYGVGLSKRMAPGLVAKCAVSGDAKAAVPKLGVSFVFDQ